jgi:hypothetical protein
MRIIPTSPVCTLLLLACASSVALAEPDELRVEYRCASFPAYLEQRRSDGTMGPPEERVLFGKGMQATHALGVKIGEKSLSCPLIYQDAASLLDDGKKTSIRILAYGGCPFQVAKLAVMKEIVLRENTVLTIEASEKDILYLSKECALPWAVGQFKLVVPCANVVNVVWKFSKPGISFQTTDAMYTSTKAGATVAFTEKGLKMDGIKTVSDRAQSPGHGLSVGMTKEQVKRNVGSPDDAFQKVSPDKGLEEAWEYKTFTLWFDDKGKLARIQKK